MSMLPRRDNVGHYKKADGRLGLTVAWPEDAEGAKQSFKAECDINTIMRKYPTEAARERFKKSPGMYADFSTLPDFESASRLVAKAKSQFENLPASAREKFRNDPGAFLDFCSNPSNAPEMAKMGLMDPKAVQRVAKEKAEQKHRVKKSSPNPKGEGADKRSASESDDEEPTS